ncbi:hypothetical protein ACFLZP_01665, partial [Patescibacteria group bacterium]
MAYIVDSRLSLLRMKIIKRIKIKSILKILFKIIVFIVASAPLYLAYRFQDPFFLFLSGLSLIIIFFAFSKAGFLERSILSEALNLKNRLSDRLGKNKRSFKKKKLTLKTLFKEFRYRKFMLAGLVYFSVQTGISTYVLMRLLPVSSGINDHRPIINLLLNSWASLKSLWIYYAVLPFILIITLLTQLILP